MAIQAALGSDIAMCFDECPPGGAPRDVVARPSSARRPGPRAAAATEPAPGQLRFGIVQGGIDLELRRRSAEALVALGFDGYAIGGLTVGEERSAMFDVTAETAALLPAERPRYFMGIGDPEGILRVFAPGVDMSDCVLPTRLGRTGRALTWDGRLNLRNARFARDPAAARRDCECPACRRFSRAYIRHLVTQDEMLGLRLLTLHNVAFLLDLAGARPSAIVEGRLDRYLAEALGRLSAPTRT